LVLRPWRPSDLDAFAVMNTDPRVVEFLPKALTREESDALAGRIQQNFVDHGFGLWAVELPGVAEFIGFTGLAVPRFTAHFTPCVETGWRLASEYWGRGYATEAARASLAYAFDELGCEEVVSFTVPTNMRSRHVMERLGMTCSREDDFDHPLVAEGHPLRRHLLYRVRREKAEC
jgi:RimJ/RimL family protein N-acetyltransferase